MPIIDSQGMLHRPGGVGGGQFASKPATPQRGGLGLDTERLRAVVEAKWKELLSDTRANAAAGRPAERVRDVVHTLTTNVSVPTVPAEQAPVSVIVGRAGAVDHFRNWDGRLWRQVFSPDGDAESSIAPPAEIAAGAHPSFSPVTELMPVTADERWARVEAMRTSFVGRDEQTAAAAVQEHFDQFAAIDGEVWRGSREPVYEVTPGQPMRVVEAPDTSAAAAPLGVFGSEDFTAAVDHARAVGIPESAIPNEDPIQVVGELPDPQTWRAGTPMIIDPPEALTPEAFASQLAAFRQQIAMIPGAVTGDVGAFLAVGQWRVDFSALTAAQQDTYRRYVLFGASNGLI